MSLYTVRRYGNEEQMVMQVRAMLSRGITSIDIVTREEARLKNLFTATEQKKIKFVRPAEVEG